jgi:RimJ/RimL family protein N-acetyltransferase
MAAIMKSYNHLPTYLPSPTHPILLRTLEPEDNAAFAAILSDPRNTDMESSDVVRSEPMELSVATSIIARMRDSAAQPTAVAAAADGGGSRGKVIRGPGRVNMAIVYLGQEGTEEGDELRRKGGLMIGIGGFGSIKDLSPATGEPVPESGPEPAGGAGREDFLRVGDVGAMINTEYRGRGFAKESVRLAMEWGFRAAKDGGLQLDEVTATTLKRNAAMVRVLDRFGWEARPKTNKDGAEELEFEIGWEQWQKR